MAYKNKEDELRYQKEWQNKKYKSNPLLFNKRRMSNKWKNTYDIDDKVIEKYKEDLHHILKINELINELNELSFAHYLIDRNVLDFSKKVKTV
jgi:hypothetical protein